MKILVTGGAGMIGSNLVKKLIDQGHEVSVVDNFWRGKIDYLKEDGKLVISEQRIFNEDLRESRKCDNIIKDYDTVYHLADIVAGINYVFSNQLSLWRSNILINSNVINACLKNKIKNFNSYINHLIFNFSIT